jgi:hypothetical protein
MGKTTGLLTITALAAVLVCAQPDARLENAPGPDVPGRAARLSFINGTVSFQPGSVEDWVQATLNRPLTTGDRLWTEADGRAEVHLGSSAIRLNGRTNFSFINLDDRTAQVQLSMGTLSIRVRRLADDEVIEIDTPQAALSLLRPGEYRVDVNEQGDTTIVSVRSGQAEATAGQAFTINPRDQVRISSAGGAEPAFDRRDVPPADPFDNWCSERDRREDFSQSAKYVSRDTPGYADLDQAGTWRTVPDYGPVWVPTSVPPGWAPYRYGHWAWIAPWGWTWVDDAPWGYAPFHYGRWVFVAGGWAWVPGPVVPAVRPVYAPALVGWVGGPSFGVAVGIGGGVGWFPLGPREVFVPAYRYSPAYVERINVTNTVIVNRGVFANVAVANVTYVNRGVVGAVTAVPGGVLVAGRPIGGIAVAVRPEVVARVQVTGVAAVVPERAAVLGGGVVVRAAPPAVVVSRTVVTRVAPPPPPVAFEHQRAVLAANPGHPVDHAAMQNLRTTAPAPVNRPMYRTAGAPTANRTAPANASPRPEPATRPENRASNPPSAARPSALPEHRNLPAPQQERKQQKTEKKRPQGRQDKEKDKS